jgi:hypothetical protein
VVKKEKQRKQDAERQRLEELIVLFVLLSFFLRVVALSIVPYPSKSPMETSFMVSVIGMVNRYLSPAHGERPPTGAIRWEGSLAQKIRDEVVRPKLVEISLSERLKPPLPRVSLFPSGEVDEQEKKVIVDSSRFSRELGEVIFSREREKEILAAPEVKTSDAKGGTIPLPEDTEAQRIIASLREAAKEEGQGKNTITAVSLDIKGPAASRRINYLPPPLESKTIVEGECLIKFWIFPDGTVSKAISLAQGEKQTVVAAIDRIKKFRFAPLPKNVRQVEQWGVIPAQSVLR